MCWGLSASHLSAWSLPYTWGLGSERFGVLCETRNLVTYPIQTPKGGVPRGGVSDLHVHQKKLKHEMTW